jgi:crotonobetainyl-CoA hydratase
MTEGFHVRRDGPIVEITIERPKANAIDGPTSRALGAAFVELDEDPDVRVAILTGAGTRFFSAGWDLAAATGGESFEDDWGAGGFGGFPELPDRRIPVIAAVNGLAVGGGFEIAMAADLVVAATHAEFFLPEARLGILPDAGTVRLPRLLPRHVATELLLTGRRMDAAEAAGWGLVNRVAPSDELLAAARAMAEQIVAAAPLAVAAILDIDRRAAHLPIADAMALMPGLSRYRAAIDSADAQEGPLAFTEKRPPVWRGH